MLTKHFLFSAWFFALTTVSCGARIPTNRLLKPWKHIIFSSWLILAVIANDINEKQEVAKMKESFGLSWRNLSVCKVGNEKNRFILNPSNGFVRNGHMCGIIGPSGEFGLIIAFPRFLCMIYIV